MRLLYVPIIFGLFAPGYLVAGNTKTGKGSVSKALSTDNYYRARWLLRSNLAKRRPTNKEERTQWSQSLLALIALERLIGQESIALKLLGSCDEFCRNMLPKREWEALQSWACKINSKLTVCNLDPHTVPE